MEKLVRVEQPTTRITGEVTRINMRDRGFDCAGRGDYGDFVKEEYERFCDKYPLSHAMFDMISGFGAMSGAEVKNNRAPIPQDPHMLSRHIKRLGYFLRADVMGICELPEWAIYGVDSEGHPITINHKYAIVVAIDQDYQTMSASTGDDWISCSQSALGYVNSALISRMISNYIRYLGYSAQPHHSGNYQVMITPLCLMAGIGEICRTGVVLNPFLGTRFKAAAVTTDLPLEQDRPVDFGLQEFCMNCEKCADECPSGSIVFGDKSVHNGYESWRIDHKSCTSYRISNQNGSSCGTCIKACPWNKPEGRIHDFVRWVVKHTHFFDRFLVWMDDVGGYSKQRIKKKWWFDLEERDGELRIPKKSNEVNIEKEG